MGMQHLAKGRGRKGGACREEEVESVLAVFEGHRRPVKCLAMAVDSNSGGPREDDHNSSSYLVYSAGLDCEIKVWQIRVPSLSL